MQLLQEKREIGQNSFKIGLFSDLHIDSKDCNRDKLKEDLQWACDNCDDILSLQNIPANNHLLQE